MTDDGGLARIAEMHGRAWGRAAVELTRIATKPGGLSDSIDDRILSILATAAIVVSHAYYQEVSDDGVQRLGP